MDVEPFCQWRLHVTLPQSNPDWFTEMKSKMILLYIPAHLGVILITCVGSVTTDTKLVIWAWVPNSVGLKLKTFAVVLNSDLANVGFIFKLHCNAWLAIVCPNTNEFTTCNI